MLLEREVVLLDADFSSDELIALIGTSDAAQFSEEIEMSTIALPRNKNELLDRLRSTSESWKISLFTSGTTGLPKKVTHTFSSITRFVQHSDKNAGNVWGFAYNPTHMAGVQVFMQALLNGNPIIRLFGLDVQSIGSEIDCSSITHVSATPTFYRLLSSINRSFENVQRITSGGERCTEEMVAKLTSLFPKAKITNVYASTEAGTLFASEDGIFSIKSRFADLVRIENDQLMIHSSLVGETETSGAINNIQVSADWYNTGDIVEVVSIDPLSFRIISRHSDIINVGGYKVNPAEVEDVISAIPGIADVRVFGKSNSLLGNIVCCEVVSRDPTINEAGIRHHLGSRLQEFKIPRMISFKETLTQTRTGKLKRAPSERAKQ